MSVRRRREPKGGQPIRPLLDRIDAADAAQRRAAERVSAVLAEVRVKLSQLATEAGEPNHDGG